MANFLYVDNSNVWIEGMHVSAVKIGMAPNIWDAQDNRISDPHYRLDFGKLFAFAGGSQADVGRAVLYGSRPPANDSLWETARKRGFEVVVFDRNASNREKKIDTSIATDMVADSFTAMNPATDEVTLVCGDRDLVPAVENLTKRSFKVHVVFWDHAATEMRNAATSFVSLNGFLDHLRL
jgi:NYN domain-containing protein